MSFKEFLKEGKEYSEAVFDFVGAENIAKNHIKDYIWDLIEKQEFVTIENVWEDEYSGDDNDLEENGCDLIFLAHFGASEKEWKEFAKYIESKSKKGYVYFRELR